MLPTNILKLKVYIKAVPYSRIARNVRYIIKVSGVSLQPCNQTSAAWYLVANHSVSTVSVGWKVNLCRSIYFPADTHT